MAYNTLVPGVNDLLTVNPTLATEWDYVKNTDLKPDMISANSAKKVWWLCKEGHSWQSAMYSRNAGRGCPYCGNYRVLAGFNDLATRNPALASEWDYERNGDFGPTDIAVTSHKDAWWLGECGHSWKARIANRSNGNGCPYCAGVSVLTGFNDLLTREPELCKQWDYEKNNGLTPDKVSWGSKRPIWWKCRCGCSRKIRISDKRRGNGCPYCSNRQPIAGVTDLQTVYPHLAAEWDYDLNGDWLPTEVTYSSPKKAWWKCQLGHSWVAEIYERHKKSTGCPVCARKINRHPAIAGVTDLKTINPTLADEWDYERNGELTPDQVLPYSNRKVWWRCLNGHHFRGIIQIRMRGTRCPYCVGKIPMRARIVK